MKTQPPGRKHITKEMREDVWKKLRSRCHFCATRILRDAPSGQRGRWHVDHVWPRANGGPDDISNYLPICKLCNKLRSNLNSREIRKTFRLGIIAFAQVRQRTEIGKKLRKLYLERKVQ